MKNLFLINKETKEKTLTDISQVSEQSGISEVEFQKKYNGDPLLLNADLHGFEYTYE